MHTMNDTGSPTMSSMAPGELKTLLYCQLVVRNIGQLRRCHDSGTSRIRGLDILVIVELGLHFQDRAKTLSHQKPPCPALLA